MKRFLILLFVLLGANLGLLLAQDSSEIDPKDNSPYSRFGLGDLVNTNFAMSSGMGRLSVAFADAYHININNPASYAFLRSTAFEVGLFAEYSQLETATESAGLWNGNLNYMVLAFPLRNPVNEAMDRTENDVELGMTIGLTPFTRVGYDVETTSELDTFTVFNRFRGSGGTYQIFWGNAIQYKGLSAGLNLGYLFGTINNSRVVSFELPAVYYFDDFVEELSVGGVIWNAGLQYRYDFRKVQPNGVAQLTGKRLVVGLTGSSNNSFNTTTSSLFTRLPVPTNAGEPDTLARRTNVKGKGTLPGSFGIGVSFEQLNKFRIGAEYIRTGWSNYTNDAKPETLVSTNRLAFGAQYIPDYASYNRYAKRMRYRAGFYWQDDPRSVNGEQLSQYGVTLGVGLPIVLPRQQVSFVDFAVEAGRFGANSNLEENYVRMTLGFTLNDNSWFFKRKFN